MHLIQALMVLFAAITISGIAAYVSVTGMMAVFPADPVTVAIIMTSLEFGKIVAVEWLHSNWKNELVGFAHKSYMCLAVFALMVVTAIGVYGFFSKGYLEQGNPSREAALYISQLEQKIEQRTLDVTHIDESVAKLDLTIDRALTGRSDLSANRANQIRNQQKAERTSLAAARSAAQGEIAQWNAELTPLKMQSLEVEAKLGPVKYLASLLGMEKTESAVQLIILVLMFAFDPFAISLVISASISFRTWSKIRAERNNAPVVPTPETSKVEQPNVEASPVVTEDTPLVEVAADSSITDSTAEEPLEAAVVDVPIVEVETPPTNPPVKMKKTKRKPKQSDTISLEQVAHAYIPEHELDKMLTSQPHSSEKLS